jgi:gluconate 2-dehydrogenase gamma chain
VSCLTASPLTRRANNVTNMDRRDFLKSIAVGGTVSIAPWTASFAEAPVAGYRIFTPVQAEMVGAIAEQIVPAGEYPGAREAGVVQFIDAKLAGPYGGLYVDRYQSGLKMVDELSQKQFGNTFGSLASDQQVSILQALDAGEHENPEGHRFFRLLLQDTFEGYYGDPEHGANRDGASWKMIGFGG